MATYEVSMGEAARLVNYAIDNNLSLEDKGIMPIAVSLEATAGIGKTSVVKRIGEDRGMTVVKLNMSQLEEAGDLIGFPCVEYECQVGKLVTTPEGEKKIQILPGTTWISAKQIDNPPAGIKYRQTGKTRMGYAKPAWVPEYNENGTLLILDDYVRANPQLLQACMDLILEQKYVSWSLPKKTTIILTNNPDDGSSNVNSLDEAQRTRFLNYEVSWDMDAWAKWAESANIDGRCINFVLSYSNEIFNADEDGNRICNPRSFVMFANMISGIKDWDNAENLSFIKTIAKGCFKDEHGRFANMFASFLRNKMHLLIQPKQMLEEKWDTMKTKLKESVYDSNGQYRADIASLYERRFSNYVCAWLGSNDKTPIKTVIDRMVELVDEGTSPTNGCIFTKDLFYHMIKTITSDHKNQTSKILFEPKLAKLMSN